MESTHPHSGVIFYVIFNAFWEILHFELPLLASGKWLRIVDTSLTDGNDIYRYGDEKHWFNGEYIVASLTVVLLIGETSCYQ
jgi:isoamylase